MQMDGALIGMESEKHTIVCVVAVVEDNMTNQHIIIIVNQATYNKDVRQHESLLQTEQARIHIVKINNLASCIQDGFGNQGKQCIETEGWWIPLLHDGSKYFLRIQEPTDVKSEIYPAYKLTSPLPWNPQEVLMSLWHKKQKANEFSDDELMNWSEQPDGIPKFLVKKTLAATTQFVNMVEAEMRTTPQHHFRV